MKPLHIRPEIELLLSCGRINIDTEKAERIKALLQEDINWDYLIRTASHQGLIPLLYRNLRSICPEYVPENILDQLQRDFYANTWHNLFLTGELFKLLDLFNKHGIPAIPYKGPVLAVFVYGDIALRRFNDLDILVHKHNVIKVRDLLRSNGYQPCRELIGKQRNAFIQFEYACSFVRNDVKAIVDLHWKITLSHHSFPFDQDQLWADLEPIPVEGKEIMSFSLENWLLFLCLHGSTIHAWEQLGLICDLANLIDLYKDIDWERIIHQTERLGWRRMFFLGLYIASDLLEVTLPEEILRRVHGDPVVKSLAAKTYKRLFSESSCRSNSLVEGSGFFFFFRIMFFLKMRERFRDKLRYCFYYLLRSIQVFRYRGLKPLGRLLR